jgi:hypothetical protein
MPHLLELFSGTGSVGKVFRAGGWDVTAVDIDPKANADIFADVLELTPETIEQLHGPPDLVWGSPPCVQYSRARTTAKTPRDLVGSDRLVQKVLDLAAHWGVPFFVENPNSGLLKDRDVVRGIPMRVVDYCKYRDERFPPMYRKRTSIWTDTAWTPARPLCRKDCGCVVDGHHAETAQRRPPTNHPIPTARRNTLDELHALPPLLCEEIFQFASLR